MKRIITIMLIVVVMLSSAAYAGEEYFKFTRSTDFVIVNGQGSDAQPYKYQDTNYLPLRKIAELLNLDVSYNNGAINLESKDKPKEVTAQEILAKVKDSVVKIETEGGTASGVVIGYGLVVTNKHVTDAGRTYKVINNEGDSPVEYKLKYSYPDIDISILENKNSNFKPCKIGDSDEVVMNKKAFLVSAPKGKIDVITEGPMFSESYNIGGVKTIATGTKADHGSSGGGIFDENGCLISIVKAGQEDCKYPFSIPINDIRKALAN